MTQYPADLRLDEGHCICGHSGRGHGDPFVY